MPRKPYDAPAREHGELQVEVHRTRIGYMAKQPSGTCYVMRPDGWRKVPESVVAEARRMAEAEAA